MSEPLIQVEALVKHFESGGGAIEVLRGLDLRIDAGESVAIVGESGVGKSTLLHILGTLDHPSSGHVRFRGDDVFDRSSPEIARFRNAFVGFVFQFHHLLPEFSSVENAMMPGLIQKRGFEEMRERAARILSDVGLADRLDHPVGRLSGGERQRVAVARALVLDPPVVLADEPTGNLDPGTGDQVGELLLEMNRSRGTTLVVATHSQSMAKRLGRVVVLRDGRLDESAAHWPHP